jgi:agmatinase
MIQSILALKDLNLVGFDIVEVSPPYDASDRTAVLGAKLIREVILLKS